MVTLRAEPALDVCSWSNCTRPHNFFCKFLLHMRVLEFWFLARKGSRFFICARKGLKFFDYALGPHIFWAGPDWEWSKTNEVIDYLIKISPRFRVNCPSMYSSVFLMRDFSLHWECPRHHISLHVVNNNVNPLSHNSVLTLSMSAAESDIVPPSYVSETSPASSTFTIYEAFGYQTE